MANKSIKELKNLIEKDIKRQEESIKQFENNTNPQIIELYLAAKARKEALNDVLYYIITGSKIGFTE